MLGSVMEEEKDDNIEEESTQSNDQGDKTNNKK